MDLVVENAGSDTVSVLLGIGDGTAIVDYGVGSGPNWVAIGDFEGNGTLDLAVANFLGDSVSILLGNGDGSFRAAGSTEVGRNNSSVVVGDFNEDGKPDLAIANSVDYGARGYTVGVLLGKGDGTFRAAVSFGKGIATSSIAEGDFNGDGHEDLVVANEFNSTVSVMLGNGDGSFRAQTDYGTGTQPEGVTVGISMAMESQT